MAISLIRTISILFVASFLISTSSSVDPFEAFFTSPSPQPHHQLSATDQSLISTLHPILSHLGFQDLAAAIPSLSLDTSAAAWNGPSTIFAPSDASLRTCPSCSVPSLLREHIVPGLFTVDYLRKLTFGTKIETLSPGRCITVTSGNVNKANYTSASAAKIFVGGVAVTHPDLFNNGLVIVHGIQGYISPLSPFSCDVERMTSLSFPAVSDRGYHGQQQQQQQVQPAIMRLMLRDAILRLRNNGFSILSLAMKVKYAELMTLNNMTMFALDDLSIFTGSPGYIHSVRFHIVPNQLLTMRDLEKLPVGTVLPTLETDQSLMITNAGSGGIEAVTPMRINFVWVKVPDMIRNLKIIVHSVLLPFPHINPTVELDRILGVEGGGCTAGDDNESCAVAGSRVNHQDQVQQLGPVTPIKATLDIEDHQGL